LFREPPKPFPQRLTTASYSVAQAPDAGLGLLSISVGFEILGAVSERVDEDQVGYSLRTLNRIDYCRRTARCNTTKGEAIRSNGFDNRLQVKDTPVEVAASRITLRRPRPAAVIKDHAPAPLNQRTDVGRTIIHVGVQVNVSEDPRRKYDGPPLAQRSGGDAHPIARLRVLDARLPSGTHSTSGLLVAHAAGGRRLAY